MLRIIPTILVENLNKPYIQFDKMYFISYEDLTKLRDVQISKGFNISEVSSELRFESNYIPNN